MKRLTIRNLMILALSVVFLCGMVICVNATIITTYMNKTEWESAVGSFLTEDFSDTTFNPGIDISSDYWEDAPVVDGKWNDKVSYDKVSADNSLETTITFTTPILAFGGTWDLPNPEGPGQGIDVTILYNSLAGTISHTTVGFWGFISSDPFDQVLLSGGSGSSETYTSETYTLDNMQYAPVPEPGTMLLVGSGLLALVGFRRKRM